MQYVHAIAFADNLRTVFTAFWHDLTRDALRPYRPELHYMRGPGPAWRAKHALLGYLS
jgi:hypothetical protein